MSTTTEHEYLVGQAKACLDRAGEFSNEGSTVKTQLQIQVAAVFANLAVAEQARISNVITLAQMRNPLPSGPTTFLNSSSVTSLIDYAAAALGMEGAA